MAKGRPRGRGGGPRAVGETVARITGQLFGKRGFVEGALIGEWPSIVGDYLARRTIPERIVFAPGERRQGILHLRTDSGSLATELQHLEPQLLERVNGHFGYRAVTGMRLHRGAIPERRRPPTGRPPRPLDEKQEKELEDRLSGVADEELRKALEALGRAVMGGNAEKPGGKPGE